MVEQTTSEPAAGSMPKISFGVKKREENKVQAPAKAVVIEGNVFLL